MKENSLIKSKKDSLPIKQNAIIQDHLKINNNSKFLIQFNPKNGKIKSTKSISTCINESKNHMASSLFSLKSLSTATNKIEKNKIPKTSIYKETNRLISCKDLLQNVENIDLSPWNNE